MVEHAFRRLGPRTWWMSPYDPTDRPALGVVVGERQTLLVEAGNSDAHVATLRDHLRRHALPEPTMVVLTHWHWDHVFGTGSLDVPTVASTETKRCVDVLIGLDWSDAALDRRVAEGVEIPFCRDNLRRELPDRAGLRIRPPEVSFRDAVSLDLGGVTCEVLHVGGDHTHDATIVHVLDDRIVFLSDCLYEDMYHPPNRYTTTKLFPLMDRLLALDAELYVWGHQPEPMTRDDLLQWTRLRRVIGETVEAAGDDRPAILTSLGRSLQRSPHPEELAVVDAFLEGLRRPDVKPVI